MEEFDSERGRRVAVAACAALLFVGLGPTVDVLLRAWPFMPANINWRFFVGTSLASTSITESLAFGSIGVICLLAAWDRGARVVGVVATLLSVSCLALLVLLALDALQLKRAVPPDGKTNFKLTVIRAGLQLVVGTVVLGYVGLANWRSSRQRSRKTSKDDGGLLVRSRTPLV